MTIPCAPGELCVNEKKKKLKVSKMICLSVAIATLTTATPHPLLPNENDTAIDIGARRELLLDGALFSTIEDLSFRLHSPVPAEKVLDFDDPWEGQKYFGMSAVGYVTVFHDVDRYRMYYASWFVTV